MQLSGRKQGYWVTGMCQLVQPLITKFKHMPLNGVNVLEEGWHRWCWGYPGRSSQWTSRDPFDMSSSETESKPHSHSWVVLRNQSQVISLWKAAWAGKSQFTLSRRSSSVNVPQRVSGFSKKKKKKMLKRSATAKVENYTFKLNRSKDGWLYDSF